MSRLQILCNNGKKAKFVVVMVSLQLGIFLNTVKRILDVLHPGIEHILKCWASCLTIEDGHNIFGEQMNGFTVTLRKKYKKYMQAIVEKLVCNVRYFFLQMNGFR